MKLRPIVILDCDDVLYVCTEYAIELANKEYRYIPRLDVREVTSWGMTGRRTDIIFKYMAKKSFYKKQPVIDGAVDFINELLALGCEIIICTAVDGDKATIRIKRLLKDFPMINPKNIFVGSRKDILRADILLDDGPHNVDVDNDNIKYRIAMARPWNSKVSAKRVSSYEEFVDFVKEIIRTEFDTMEKGIYMTFSGKTKALG